MKNGRDRSAHNLNVDIMIVVYRILTLKNNEYVMFLLLKFCFNLKTIEYIALTVRKKKCEPHFLFVPLQR